MNDMEGKAIRGIWIDLLRSELNGAGPNAWVREQMTSEVLRELFQISKRQDLAHVTASALRRNGVSIGEVAGADLAERYTREEMLVLYRHERNKHTYAHVCDVLSDAKIDYMPLKGAVIRGDYPDERMRTSCDIDILVREEDLALAADAMEAAGYQNRKQGYHDISLFSPGGVHVELHFNLNENLPTMDAILGEVWQNASPVSEQTHMYAMTDAFLLFHLIAHMAYHFLSGGCGIRALMDIWVMQQSRGISYIQASDFLHRAKLYDFAVEITTLADICFSENVVSNPDPFYDTLLEYILRGGLYGTAKNRIAVTSAKSKNALTYAFRRLFPPFHIMTVFYPILRKWPILLPFCWIARPFERLFTDGRGGRALLELQTASAQDDDERAFMQTMRDRLRIW